ncbi:MAG: catechol-2,3-dioxygenase [Candidatus Pseudothioglobus sp.]|jgi:catechol-2,3-dioxygenase
MLKPPALRLDHINLPARKPSWLAEWYAGQFGFTASAGFVMGAGVLLVFELGEPLDTHGKPHFGFRCDSSEAVAQWAAKFEQGLEDSGAYCGFKTRDPEGNVFEIYWEN